ncbi:MAG: transporter substrate-binding domain-containing protein, partial [Sulfurimonadaceae bacterium]|nr:transporter substrate-binding domain-containing protein [Sulfurimonadaceae bacterium]
MKPSPFFRLLLLLLPLLSLAATTQSPSHIDTTKPKAVTIAYNVGNPPLKFKNDRGEADGILIDIWKLWSKKSGVPVVFKEALFADTLEMVKNGEADIHAGLFYTEERDKFFDYSSKPIIDISYHIFHHKSISTLKDVDDLRGFKVGVPKGYTETFMQERLPETHMVVYDNFIKLYDEVAAGNIKTFISPVMNFEYYLLANKLDNEWRYDAGSTVYKREYMSAVKEGNSELLKTLNEGLAKISEDEIIAIERKWLKSPIKINGKKETYIISCDIDFPPLTMINQQGEAAGLYIDLWRLWAQKQNVDVKFVFGTWGESLNMVKT